MLSIFYILSTHSVELLYWLLICIYSLVNTFSNGDYLSIHNAQCTQVAEGTFFMVSPVYYLLQEYSLIVSLRLILPVINLNSYTFVIIQEQYY